MNLKLQKLCIVIALLSNSLTIVGTHYINKTGKTIKITNVTASAPKNKKSYFNFWSKSSTVQPEIVAPQLCIEIENGEEGDLDNNQGDEITITSQGMSDKRKLFPTNNSFNYVITLNKYNASFEKFDINHPSTEEKAKPKKAKKIKKAVSKKTKKVAAQESSASNKE